ncbi:amidase [Tabrizicola sp.]|uniref:amidase n=1 Tax=Tabrizicola sp. TaxID=2005166 RepID=UPI00286CC727|nr:amidase [Tabrizicola sp.]
MLRKTECMVDQIAALCGGDTTARLLAEAALSRAQVLDGLNAFVALDAVKVLAAADASDARRAVGTTLGPLDGIPIAVKDNYLTRDYPTTACSNALPLEPPGVDATLVARLREAGAVIFGKTNMHEWAYGATNTTSSFGPTCNPHNLSHITGGSSGGSAASVAGGIVTAALGSDTGGSIRIPASACGIYGFKPTYGRASRHGVLPLSWSLDAPGPLAASLDDIAVLLSCLLGEDPGDAATRGSRPFQPVAAFSRTARLVNLTGPGLERSDEVDAAVTAALQSARGCAVETRELPGMRRFFGAWETILHCEATAYHQPRLAAQAVGFSAVTRAHLEAGQYLSAQELLRAQQVRAEFCALLASGLGDWDALVLPTLPVPAPAIDSDWQEFGGRRVSTQDSMTWFCWLGNLAGLPAVTLPCGLSSTGLPIGIMLMGRPGQDETLLQIAKLIDTAVSQAE